MFIMDATTLIKTVISIFTYWLQFNILFILCDLDIVANTTANINILGLNQTNGKSNKKSEIRLNLIMLKLTEKKWATEEGTEDFKVSIGVQ